jgi:sugar diacid utilization regulator
MRGLVQRVRRSDPDAANALAVIAAFDELTASQSPLEELASAAAQLADCSVLVTDLWNGRAVQVTADGVTEDDPTIEPVELDLPAYGAVEVDGALLAAVQTAGGAVGLVRLESIDKQWRDLDFMVAERLAASVAIDATKVHQQGLADSRLDPGALVQLITTGLSEPQLQLALTRAQLPADRELVAMAVQSRNEAVGPQVAGRLLVQALGSAECIARTATVDRFALVVAVDGPALRDAVAGLGQRTWPVAAALSVGFGSAGSPRDLPASWNQAVQTVALIAPPERGVAVSAYGDLGALALLGRLPATEVEALPDIVALRQLESADPLDIQLLESYCESGSMRTVAQQNHMHHSSVDYRLKRIGKALNIDLGTSTGRLRALLAVKLLRVARVRLPS